MRDLDQIAEEAPPASSKTVHLLRQLKAAGEPISISINGRAGIPVSDDVSLGALIELVDRLELINLLSERLKALDEGEKTYTLDEAKEMIRRRHGLQL